MDISKPSLLIPRIARKLRVIPLLPDASCKSHLSVIAAKDGASLSQYSQSFVRDKPSMA